ncbi:MAG: DMT family transporter [Synergistaceae bacterium]|nr:DMT family transporter [Synergistaceae bacterium]
MKRDNFLQVYILATLTVIFWGASFAGAKVALEQADPLLVMFLRFVLSLALLLPVAWYCGELRLPTRRQTLVLAFMGFMGFFFHIGIQTVAMRSSGSATANWQMAAAPAMTALFASFFLKERLSRGGVFGIILAFLGVAVVLGLGTKGARGISSYNFGDFLISLSVLNWAAFMVLTRWLFKENRYPPVFTRYSRSSGKFFSRC